MAYWLMKSEPDECSIDDVLAAKDRITPWSGVRNYQARNFMKDRMKVGDGVLFYHSSCPEPGIAGILSIAGAARPDPTQFDRKSEYHDPKSRLDDPTWLTVDVRFVRRLPRVIGLEELRGQKTLAAMHVLRRGNRLSVTPVTAAEWRRILALV